jgi:hypothetical protein
MVMGTVTDGIARRATENAVGRPPLSGRTTVPTYGAGCMRTWRRDRKQGAASLAIDEKQIRRCYKPNRSRGETGKISVAAVDKALLYMDTNIRDLYPEIFDE